MHEKKFYIFFIFFFLIMLSSAKVTSAEDNTVYWPHFTFPPYEIADSNGNFHGIFLKIEDILFRNTPQYNHCRTNSEPGVSLMSAQNHTHMCLLGLLKTRYRESYLTFSLPIGITAPTVAVVKKSLKRKFKFTDPISIKQLINNPNIMIGVSRGLSYGPEIDRYLLLPHDNVTVYEGHKFLKKGSVALNKGMVDVILLTPELYHYNSERRECYKNFTALKIKESNAYLVRYLACPNDRWGRQVIKDMNPVIAEMAEDGRLLELYIKYIPHWCREKYILNFKKEVLSAALKWKQDRIVDKKYTWQVFNLIK